jgi:hypothetical protein
MVNTRNRRPVRKPNIKPDLQLLWRQFRHSTRLALVVLILTLLLSTCTFLTSDIFPYWLSFVEASVDLRAISTDLGLGSDPIPEAVEYAPFVYLGTDYSKVLVYLRGIPGQERLLLLDPKNLALKEDLIDTGFRPILASAAGGFLCGERTISPLDFTIDMDPAWGGSMVRLFRVGIGLPGLNYVVEQVSNNQANFFYYDVDWTRIPIVPDPPRDFDSSNNDYQILDADYAQGYSVLGRRFSLEYGEQGYVASFATPANFTAAGTVFDSAVAVKTGPFPVADNRAWLTAGGPVAFDRSDKDSRLVRYKYGTGNFSTGAKAEELDSIIFDEDDLKILSFDPSGQWWFVYDRYSGRLYKLRTWWK